MQACDELVAAHAHIIFVPVAKRVASGPFQLVTGPPRCSLLLGLRP